jgi:hypothetical protein
MNILENMGVLKIRPCVNKIIEIMTTNDLLSKRISINFAEELFIIINPD